MKYVIVLKVRNSCPHKADCMSCDTCDWLSGSLVLQW